MWGRGGGLETRGLQIGLGHLVPHVAHSPGEDFTNDVITSCKAGSTCSADQNPKNHQIENMSKDIIVYIYITNIMCIYSI